MLRCAPHADRLANLTAERAVAVKVERENAIAGSLAFRVGRRIIAGSQ